jgi:hypothetical protein
MRLSISSGVLTNQQSSLLSVKMGVLSCGIDSFIQGFIEEEHAGPDLYS